MNAYSYSSQPHAAPPSGKHFRPRKEKDALNTLTLMSDPRVIRGNTHSLALKISKAKSDLSKSTMGLPIQKNVLCESQPTYEFEVKTFTTDEIDTNMYLVAKNDLPVKTKEVNSQTNNFIKTASDQEYVPRKTGVDRATQVDDVSDLFSFEVEVVPMLEVIIEKTLTQALYEVQTEEELECLKQAVKDCKLIQQEEALWIKTLEEKAIAEDRRMRNLINTQAEAKEAEVRSLQSIAGLQMMKQILPSILDGIIAERCGDAEAGGWRDPVRTDAEQNILPGFSKVASTKLTSFSAAADVIDSLLLSAEDLYHNALDSAPSLPARTIQLNITFMRSAEDQTESAGADEDGDRTTALRIEPEQTLLSIEVLPEDSIDSVEKKIKSDIMRLQKLQITSTDEAGEVENHVSLNKPTAALVLPDQSAPLNLKTYLNAVVLQVMGPPARDIATDGRLFNFPLPDIIEIQIAV